MEKLSRDELYVLGLKLDSRGLLNLCNLNKKFYEKICKDENFWREKLIIDYPSLQNYNISFDFGSLKEVQLLPWKKFYLEMIHYISKLEEEYGIYYQIEEIKNMRFQLGWDYNPKNIYMDQKKLLKLIELNIWGNNYNIIINYAAKNGHIDIVRYAVQNGVKSDSIRDSIDIAKKEGYHEIVNYLTLAFRRKREMIRRGRK